MRGNVRCVRKLLFSTKDVFTTPMRKFGLFVLGEYWVVGVDIDQYDESDPGKYLRGLLQDEMEPKCLRAFRSYLGVAPSPPTNLTYFASQVNKYMEEPPFNYPNPLREMGGDKQVSLLEQFLSGICKLIFLQNALYCVSIRRKNTYSNFG